MRKIVVNGVKTKLSERDYKQLLRRFDIENTEELINSSWLISIRCICGLHPPRSGHHCSQCPFHVFDEFGYGCIRMLETLKLNPSYAKLSRISVHWTYPTNRSARTEITAIRNWLLSLEKVR